MMSIHTVAAGGGSILHFDGARYRVGPDSAGANPGPACYRRGGPLTVTDANVMLGKIQPEHFPRCSARTATSRSTPSVVRDKFARARRRGRARRRATTAAPRRSPRASCDIAVRNMANAIKQISVQRGHDVTALHAALLRRRRRPARLPGRRRARHRRASSSIRSPGVLSAYGMGLADADRDARAGGRGAARRRRGPRTGAGGLRRARRADARGELVAQGVPPASIAPRRAVHLRYDGHRHRAGRRPGGRRGP